MKNNKGLSLIEIIVILVIIMMLTSIISSVVKGKKREREEIKIEKKENLSNTGKILTGEHELKLMIYEVTDNDIERYYFLNTPEGLVYFKWKMNDGTIAISKLPLDKIRIKHDNITTPTIKFKWKRCRCDNDLSLIMKEAVIYAVINCEEEHWKFKEKL